MRRPENELEPDEVRGLLDVIPQQLAPGHALACDP
jgi:hypothetical protein